MRITVNGEPLKVDSDITVAELLRVLTVQDARVAVEVNLEVVRKQSRGETQLREGDTVEIVSFVGGGV